MCELRKRGLVTAVIYSGPFEKLGRNEITHPLGGLALEDVKGRAAEAAPQFAELVRKYAS